MWRKSMYIMDELVFYMYISDSQMKERKNK